MAKTDRFYIGQLDGPGLQTNVRPFLIPDNAFASLNNAYIFRGRLVKRFGAELMQGSSAPVSGYEQLVSRLRINIGSSLTGNIVSSLGIAPAIGQMFSIGSQIFTVQDLGNPVTMLNTGAGTGTYDTTTGAYVFTGTFSGDFYFYPALPVMGLVNYEQADINFEPLFAFDTQFAYQYANGWERLGTASWSGSTSDFFWGTNWRGITSNQTFLFVTNYIPADTIKYYNPTVAANWTSMSPVCNNTFRLLTARIILPFKDRLLMLNTIENEEGIQFSAPNTTNSSTGDFDQTVAGSYSIGQQFIVGNTIFTIASVAAGLQDMTVSSLPGVSTNPTAQFNASTGNLVITGNGTNLNLPVYFFAGTGGTQTLFVNRCRFSLNGDPTRTNGWIDQAGGLGGYIDAPTKEAIITAQFLKDRLIVYFESSTWELVYTGNQILPFVWQQINTELGAESTFSQVPFDKVVLGIGNVGVHACNGSNVERIDNNIPDTVFEIHNANSGPERVYGIRDYFAEVVYWSYPDSNRTTEVPYNNKILVYNYKTGSWSINDDSVTAFGYYQTSTPTGDTWQDSDLSWQEATYPWQSAPLQGRFKNIVAGNQEGFVFIVKSNDSNATNCPALQITDMNPTTGEYVVINHNLEVGNFVKIQNVQGITGVNDTIVKVASVTNEDTFFAFTPTAGVGVYTGGGTLTKVTPIDITTKQYNFYAKDGYNATIQKIDFLVLATSQGEFSVDYYISTSAQSIVEDATLTGTLLGSSILQTSPYDLYPLEQSQNRLWHPLYLMAEGECIQMRYYLTDDQALDPDIVDSGFEIHAMTIYAQPTSSRLQ